MYGDDKILNLKEINKILQEIGGSLTECADIIAVGGYCMLVYKARDSTQDVDFIPSESEFVVPFEYSDIINKDILNIKELSLEYDELRSYCLQAINFGKLTVHLADCDLLFAMKVFAMDRRSVTRDSIDFEWLLNQNVNRKRAYKVYRLITHLNPSFDEWSNDIDTDLFLIKAGRGDEFAVSNQF